MLLTGCALTFFSKGVLLTFVSSTKAQNEKTQFHSSQIGEDASLLMAANLLQLLCCCLLDHTDPDIVFDFHTSAVAGRLKGSVICRNWQCQNKQPFSHLLRPFNKLIPANQTERHWSPVAVPGSVPGLDSVCTVVHLLLILRKD